jgi:hypothetical protein
MTDEMTRNMSVWWTASEYANKLPAAMLSSLFHPPLPVLNENVQTKKSRFVPSHAFDHTTIQFSSFFFFF